MADWGKQGSNTPAYNSLERHSAVVAYAQTSEANKNKNKQSSKANATKKAQSPTAADSKIRYDKLDLNEWGKQGNATSAFAHKDAEYVQTKSDIQVDKKDRMASDQFPAVQKELAKEKADELVKPTAPAENNKDSEPKWMQMENEVKANWVNRS